MRRLVWGSAVGVALLLAGCAGGAPEPEPSAPPVGDPSPSLSVEPSGPVELTIPGTCDDLVSLADIRAIFDPAFMPIAYEPGTGDPEFDSFAARGGLSCIWGIPDSDAGVLTIGVAPRAMADDAAQVATWVSQGLTECRDFLDECYYEGSEDEIGSYHRAYVLVEGFELQAFATTTALDPLLLAIREATDSMGYR